MSTISPQRLAAIFVEAADTLVDEFDLLDFLHRLADRAVALVDAAAVAIMLADARGTLQFMAGSDTNVKLVELFEPRNQESPFLQAFRTAQPVIDVDLNDADDRWPQFASEAVAAGFQAVHAFPLRLREQTIGALSVFGATKGGDFVDTDVTVMQALADVATIALLQERAISRGEDMTNQLQEALNSRILIEQAKGVVAQARGVDVDQAFDSMRRFARNNNRRLTDLAAAIVGNRATVESLPEAR